MVRKAPARRHALRISWSSGMPGKHGFLRHTCGHNLVEAGASLDRIAAILGHEKLDTTTIYTTPSDRELQREVEKIVGE